ncbi:sensor histidine kinase [Nocardioides sp. Kera G14]|uniref:sensor histidine kinase n=1 Tax=Nocardioides sp. Kera G14 TaxID=2884264 RepID=UPI001D0FEFF6|nr:HAMP domain-containing sensor histidine kinase [Nocardioides sp. Kera G14]UDY25292.1 HAMP domain-containing histidine kinase [Nocardioides sp. Kera G14]
MADNDWELERSDLVATLAHELRSPLTGVKGFVQAVLNRWDKLTDEQKKFMLTTALVDADRLSRLITEMLDVARLDTGRLQLHRRPTDPGPIVQRVVDNVRMSTSRTISLDVAGDLPQIDADPDKLAQVLTNLVDNGVRHGDGDVVVTVAPLDDAVRYRIEDEGDGIPEQVRENVFTKWWKGDRSMGTGLGLYVVGGLVNAHGGSITIGDRPGGGARIDVSWPVSPH